VRGSTTPAGGLASATPTLSRRRLLRNTAIGTAVAGSGLATSLLQATPAEATTGEPVSFLPTDPDLHLLRRATWGPTPGNVKRIHAMGADAWLEEQLRPGLIDDSACGTLITTRFAILSTGMTAAFTTLDGTWELMQQLGLAAIARATWSRRQLYEVMVDFWSNHLNVTNPSDNVWWSRHDYDRAVIRRHALGKFSSMLAASATHPAMMMYLNNAESTGDDPNENYGRELLELHTVGVEAGYTEDEMTASALALTGFGISWDTGAFEYHPEDHYTGHLSVLGWSATNGSAAKGYDMGLAYLNYLAHHPATAHHIATKLCERFVSDTPSRRLVRILAQTYLDNDTAIVPVLRALFHTRAFAASMGTKVQRPMQDVVSTLRILGIRPDAGEAIDGIQELGWMLDGLSDLPYAWPLPNGYPDQTAAWCSAGGTLARWNTHLSLAAGWSDHLQVPDLRTNLLPATLPATHGELVQALAQRLVFRSLSATHRNAVLGFLGRTTGDALHAGDEAVGWRLPYLVALILDSPYHGIR
jgi:uncharacterized protein (DUF1800 family)